MSRTPDRRDSLEYLERLAKEARDNPDPFFDTSRYPYLIDYATSETVSCYLYDKGAEHIARAKGMAALTTTFDRMVAKLHEILVVALTIQTAPQREVACNTDGVTRFICHLWGMPESKIRRGDFDCDGVKHRSVPDAMKIGFDRRKRPVVTSFVEATTSDHPKYFTRKLHGLGILQERFWALTGSAKIEFYQPEGTKFPLFCKGNQVIPKTTPHTQREMRFVIADLYNNYTPNPTDQPLVAQLEQKKEALHQRWSRFED